MSNGHYQGVHPEKHVITIITTGRSVLLVKQAEDAGKALADQKLTKSQIRTVFAPCARSR